ncbi:MAG: inositol monophosphatase [Flammeovirgaceae bacterium]|jgi:myo-inositol-1(or 4)-monophosphatase|nr:inositol monophosphatase [Flammeovirgaceae bacterium]|tara:strand:- start:21075 stop:21860 length:786 start_codon:yes stop_codon:yes gene_type:complete
MNLEEIVTGALPIIKETGRFIQKEAASFDLTEVILKGKNDLVSYVDKEAEKMIVVGLKILLPDAGFITEEGTVSQEQKEFTWIIDPLDGTTNFIHGLPIYSISVGLMKQGEMVGGIVYELNKDEIFYAWKGGGAFMNHRPIRVSPVKDIAESLLATGFPYYNFDKLPNYLAILNELMINSHGLRRLGSAAVDLAYVACGRCEGFFEYNLNSWDIAAGILLVKEAGGVVTDFSGNDNALFGRELVASGHIQIELLDIIAKHW